MKTIKLRMIGVLFVASNRTKVEFPFCKHLSSEVHSTYQKAIQDLLIQGKKVTILLNNRIMFCNNSDCSHATFSEKFDFIRAKARKTKRLEQQIINISLNVSSITASNLINEEIADIGKSSICNLLKKRYTNY